MQITETKVKVSDLCKNYKDDGNGGVYGYDGKLTIRPSYQREFTYNEEQRANVIKTVLNNRPLNIMYWNKVSDDDYEVLDGQQRTISLGQYLNGDFAIKDGDFEKTFQGLSSEKQKIINDYELTVYICEGTDEERIEWFKTINIAGKALNNQEILNATYVGTWLADAKNYFSKPNCVAKDFAKGYVKGNVIEQQYLEKALNWIRKRDKLKNIENYMAAHQHDTDANDLWIYFQNVINWAKTLFPTVRKGITDNQDWGTLYNKYHNNTYNSNTLESEIQKLVIDDDVEKNAGIIEYLLSDKTKENCLQIRAFTEAMKQSVYEKQTNDAKANNTSNCPLCAEKGIDKIYKYEEMEGDHIKPWSKGGHTEKDNLQMLCIDCNRAKSNH